MLMISGPVLLGYALILSLALAVLNKNGVGGSLTAVVALGLCVLVPAILAPGIRRQPMGIHNVRLWVLWAVVPTAAVVALSRLQMFQRHPWWLLLVGPIAFLIAVVIAFSAHNIMVAPRSAQ